MTSTQRYCIVCSKAFESRDPAGWICSTECSTQIVEAQKGFALYRAVLERIAKAIGPEAFVADDGTELLEPNWNKLSELVEGVVAREKIEHATAIALRSKFNTACRLLHQMTAGPGKAPTFTRPTHILLTTQNRKTGELLPIRFRVDAISSYYQPKDPARTTEQLPVFGRTRITIDSSAGMPAEIFNPGGFVEVEESAVHIDELLSMPVPKSDRDG